MNVDQKSLLHFLIHTRLFRFGAIAILICVLVVLTTSIINREQARAHLQRAPDTTCGANVVSAESGSYEVDPITVWRSPNAECHQAVGTDSFICFCLTPSP